MNYRDMQFSVFIFLCGYFSTTFAATPQQDPTFKVLTDYLDSSKPLDPYKTQRDIENKLKLQEKTEGLLQKIPFDETQIREVIIGVQSSLVESTELKNCKSKAFSKKKDLHYFHKDFLSFTLKMLLATVIKNQKSSYAKNLTLKEQVGVFEFRINADECYKEFNNPKRVLASPELHCSALKVIELSLKAKNLIAATPVCQLHTNEALNKSLQDLKYFSEYIKSHDRDGFYTQFSETLTPLTFGTINGQYARAFGTLGTSLTDDFLKLLQTSKKMNLPEITDFLLHLSLMLGAAEQDNDPYGIYFKKNLLTLNLEFNEWAKDVYKKTLTVFAECLPEEFNTGYTFDKVSYNIPEALDKPFTLKKEINPSLKKETLLQDGDEWITPTLIHRNPKVKKAISGKAKKTEPDTTAGPSEESLKIPFIKTKKEKPRNQKKIQSLKNLNIKMKKKKNLLKKKKNT